MKLMLLDGNSIINRAYYGIRMLTTKDGTPTNAVYGFLAIYRRLMAEEAPDAVCVTFDLKAPTFRHEMFDGYKAKRKPMPGELAVQIPLLKEVLDAMNVRRCESEGHEADDLIGTMSALCEKEGVECVVVTGDKDSFQLISDTTKVRHVKSRMGQTETMLYDNDTFFEEYGFEPAKIVDLKALMGDASDNIPGVAGIGEKTAMDLVRRFGTVDGIYNAISSPDIKDSVRKKLESGKEAAELSRTLALIERDAPLNISPADCAIKQPDNDRLWELFEKLEFRKMADAFGITPPSGTIKPDADAVFSGECISVEVCSEETLEEMKNAIGSGVTAVRFAADFRIAAAVCDETADTETAYIIRDTSPVYREAMEALCSDSVRKAGHDIKDTMRQLHGMGYPIGGWEFDSALAAYLDDPTASGYALDRLTERYCNFTPMRGAEEENGQLSLLSDDVQETARLTSEAAAVLCLREVFLPGLEEKGMGKLLCDVEMPLCPVLADMEEAGFLVDRGAIIAFGETLSAQIDSLMGRIYKLTGEEFKINSPKQLGAVLFEKLMLPAPKKTKTGWSTNADVLERLRDKHPIIPMVLEYRRLSKLKSTYCDGLLKVIAPDGRIHTNFQMTVTATGRLSSTEPNLQNIPVRTELGREMRRMFVAAPGNVLVDADYSQIELRLLAHISGDGTMINAFKNGEDIHTVTAAQVLGIAPSEVTPQQRSHAKAVNFGIVYGISAFSLAQDIGTTVTEAKGYMDGYLEKYHGVREYMKRVIEEAKRDGYVATLYGRRRPLPELKSSNRNVSAFGERVALNAPIQGTAADIMKIAMISAYRRLKDEVPEARLILQVHDELLVECPEDCAERAGKVLREAMESAAALSVPLTAETSTGRTWYEAK